MRIFKPWLSYAINLSRIESCAWDYGLLHFVVMCISHGWGLETFSARLILLRYDIHFDTGYLGGAASHGMLLPLWLFLLSFCNYLQRRLFFTPYCFWSPGLLIGSVLSFIVSVIIGWRLLSNALWLGDKTQLLCQYALSKSCLMLLPPSNLSCNSV